MMTKSKQNKINPIPYFITCLFMMIFFDMFLTNNVLTESLNKDFKVFEIVLIKNTGAAFSFLENHTLLLILVSFIALFIILYELFKNTSKYSTLTYFFSSIFIAGIFCNLYERISLGYVRDFISIKYINFPIFNISDILINLAVLAIIFLVITKKHIKNDR